MEDKIVKIPLDVMKLIFSQCEVVDLVQIGRTCKQFHEIIFTEEMYKKISVLLWERLRLNNYTKRFIEKKEKGLKEVKWKTLANCLSNKDGEGYAFTMKSGDYSAEDDEEFNFEVVLGKFENSQLVSDAIEFMIDGQIFKMFKGDICSNNGEGQGSFYNSYNEEYHGSFSYWKPHGEGILTRTDGVKYEGNFKDNYCHGQGEQSEDDR